MIKKLFYILALTLVSAPLTMGQSIGTFTTYPSKTINQDKWIVRDVNPGRNYQESITVENLSDQNIELKIDIIESTGDRDNIRLLENQSGQQSSNLIKVDENLINLSPYEKKQVNLKINIPVNQKLGEYQAVALVSQTSKNSQNLNISTRIGNRLYLNITDQNILQTNTFSPDTNIPQITLILLSIVAIVYGFLPAKKAAQTVNYE